MTMETELMTNDELDQKLKDRPAPRVTKEYIDSRIVDIDYDNAFHTVTICNILLDNGFSVRGESACVDPENFDAEIGKKLAYDNAFRKLWPLFGFLLAESLNHPNGNGFRDAA